MYHSAMMANQPTKATFALTHDPLHQDCVRTQRFKYLLAVTCNLGV